MLVVGCGSWARALARILDAVGLRVRLALDPQAPDAEGSTIRRGGSGPITAIVAPSPVFSPSWANQVIRSLRSRKVWCEKVIFALRDARHRDSLMNLDPWGSGSPTATLRQQPGHAALHCPVRIPELLAVAQRTKPMYVEEWSALKSASRIPGVAAALLRAEALVALGDRAELTLAVSSLLTQFDCVEWEGLIRKGIDPHVVTPVVNSCKVALRSLGVLSWPELCTAVVNARRVVEQSFWSGEP